MNTSYLTWMKNLDPKLHHCPDCYKLHHSDVYEPTEIFFKDLERAAFSKELLQEPNPWGHPRLLEAISNKYGIEDTSRVLVTGGASAAIYLVCKTLLAKGDHVIVEAPTYEPFLAAPQSLGAEVTRFRRRRDGFKADLEELESLVTLRTRLIILSNLHNPSSAFLEDELLQGIAAIARKFRVKILMDEIYHDFVEDRQQPAATLDDGFISISSLSKVYGLSVLRCGWILASPEIIRKIRGVHTVVENTGSRLTQAVAAMVVENIGVYREHWSRVVSRNREIVREVIGPLQPEFLTGDIPPNGCMFFPQVVGVNDASAFANQLKARRVFVAPGRFFGEPARIRIGFGGAPAELQKGLEILAEEIKAIKRCYERRN